MKVYTVIDRASRELRDTGLTAVELIDRHVIVGQRSAVFPLVNTMKVGEEMRLGAIIARRTA